VKFSFILIIQLIILKTILFSGNTFAQLYDPEAIKVQNSKETNDTIRINLIIRYVMFYGTGQDYYKLMDEIQGLSLKNNYRPGLVYHVSGKVLFYRTKMSSMKSLKNLKAV
jgi:hypothetical protein